MILVTRTFDRVFFKRFVIHDRIKIVNGGFTILAWLETKMKKFKEIFKGKTSKNLNTSASGSIGGASGSLFFNGYDIKEKDLPKIHKAAWTGDISKVRQLAKKDPTSLDKENR